MSKTARNIYNSRNNALQLSQHHSASLSSLISMQSQEIRSIKNGQRQNRNIEDSEGRETS